MSSNLTNIIEYNGKKIVYTDMSGVTPEEAMSGAPELVKTVKACGENSALVLTNLKDAKYNKDSLKSMLKTQKENKPYVLKSAVIGLNGLEEVIFQTYNALADREIKIFKDIEEAKDWLTN